MTELLRTPISLPRVDTTRHKWSILADLPQPFLTHQEDGWRIEEKLDGKTIFSLRRDYVTQRRYTDVDLYGLLGLSRINLNKKSVVITEGVSDYITAKLLLPESNVLGITTLGGSPTAKKILISLFEQVLIIHDADPAGITGLMKWRTFLEKYGVKTFSWCPTGNFKDLTEQFLFNYKIDNTEIQF